MRACEADRCDQGATVEGRWCPRHVPGPTAGNYAKAREAAEPLAELASALEYALEGHSGPELAWGHAEAMVDEAEWALKRAREGRLAVLQAWRDQGMSLGDIAEVTGLTRQRIGQLLKG